MQAHLTMKSANSKVGPVPVSTTEKASCPPVCAMKKYLIALPCFYGAKGFNHQTILVSAKNERDARAITRHLRPNANIGEIKNVNYQGETK